MRQPRCLSRAHCRRGKTCSAHEPSRGYPDQGIATCKRRSPSSCRRIKMTRPTPSTPQWRELSDAEFAATPDAKLGGTLAIIVAAAATEGLHVIDYLQMAPYILFNVMIAAAFCGYMREGRRPNLFYRRRVRI